MTSVLLTGFEPFRHYRVNSSWEAAKHAQSSLPQIRVACLPVAHLAAADALATLLESERPQICLCTGLAEGEEFRVERMARPPPELAGWGDGGITDSDTSPALEGPWPVSEIEHTLLGLGHPVRVSSDAGRYVCESTYWALLDYRRRRHFPEWAGFLHLPPLSEKFRAEQVGEAVAEVLRARLRDLE